MAFNVSALGFGDNVVDRYEHIRTMYPGGNAVNFAVYAKKCGAARVTVVNGDRVFLGSNEGGIRGDARYVLDRFDLAYVKQFDVVHSGNYCFTERELPKLKAAGITVSFDFSDDSTDEYYEQIAPYVDFAFFSAADAASEDEIRERLAWVRSLGPRFVSATAGAEGCIAYDGDRYYRQLAKSVTDMKDTMGAGDSFLTSFLMCYLDSVKRGEDGAEAIERALDFAAGFASTVCGMEGSWGHGVPISE